MRVFGNQKTHASNGEELSEFFLDDNGTLSVYVQENETEILGFHQTVFGGGWIVQEK